MMRCHPKHPIRILLFLIATCCFGQTAATINGIPNQTLATGTAGLLPAVKGAGIVSVSGTTVSGTTTNFTSLFPLCATSCSHGEAIAIYPAQLSPSGFVIASSIPGTTINNGETGSLIWNVGGTFAVNAGDTVTPTRTYANHSGVPFTQREFWSIATAYSSNKLQTLIPVYPAVGSRYPYPYIIVSGSSATIYLNTPPNATNGQTVVVASSSTPSLNGNYVISDNTGGQSLSAASSTGLVTNNPASLASGIYFADDMTMTISSVDIGGASCSTSALAKCVVSISVAAGSGSCTPQCATATFIAPHGFAVGDSIHVAGFSGSINATSATVVSIGSANWSTTLTFGTSAAASTSYAAQGGTISAAYTVNPHPIWVHVASVTSATSLTLSSSGGTIASGATWESAPDNVAAFTSAVGSNVDIEVTQAANYYFNNIPSNTSQTNGSILVTAFNHYFGVTSGVNFILASPQYDGFSFGDRSGSLNGGTGFVLDNWEINSLYQLPSLVCTTGCAINDFAKVLQINYADSPVVRNIRSTKSVGNFMDIENVTQPKVQGFNVSNISDGGCLVFAATPQPLASDGICLNAADYTSIFTSSNYSDPNMRGAVMTNFTEVNVKSGLFISGPGVVASNFYIEAGPVDITPSNGASPNLIGDIRLSNFQIDNGGQNGLWQADNGSATVEMYTPSTGVYIDNFSIRGGHGPAFVILGDSSATYVSIANTHITGAGFLGLYATGSGTAIDLSNVDMQGLGGTGMFLNFTGKVSVNGMKIQNVNQIFSPVSTFSLLAGTAFVVGGTSGDVRNVQIIDTQATATGYLMQVGGGRTQDVIGIITDTGHPFQTVGGTAGSAYVLNAGYVFPTIASASTISPISANSYVSGSTTVATITVPTGMQPQDQFCFIPSAGATWITNTSGNIGTASVASPGVEFCERWDGTKFWPQLTAVSGVRSIGASFGVKGGTSLATGQAVYVSVPFACTIAAWTLMIDAGTITIDVWKIGSGTAVPTVANTITASALPAISTGTAKTSTTLTGWTTSVAANDLLAFDVNAISTATTATIQLQCNQ